MKLSELNSIIDNLEQRGEIDLLTIYYNRRSHLLERLSDSYKEMLFDIISHQGIGALSTEQLQIAQYLSNRGLLN